MKIGSLVLLAAFSWAASGLVSADSRQHQQMRAQSAYDGEDRFASRSMLRYQDSFFSLSYRYNDSGLRRHNRFPMLGQGLRHRHYDVGFGLHRHPPKYGYGRQQQRHFSAHKRGDRYSDSMRPDRNRYPVRPGRN